MEKGKQAVEVSRFVKNADGTVTDKIQKVVWGSTFKELMTWEEAKKACKNLGKGWRLPTVNELFSLVDRKKRRPAIDVEFFPDTKYDDWYWTSEELSDVPDGAWVVGFYGGYVAAGYKSYRYCVRPVRASQ